MQVLTGTVPKKNESDEHKKLQKDSVFKKKDIKIEKESYIDLLNKLAVAKDKGRFTIYCTILIVPNIFIKQLQIMHRIYQNKLGRGKRKITKWLQWDKNLI